jgi:hypothetical protein
VGGFISRLALPAGNGGAGNTASPVRGAKPLAADFVAERDSIQGDKPQQEPTAETTNTHELVATTFAMADPLAKLLSEKGLITQEDAGGFFISPPVCVFFFTERALR